jgi:hypothetical protein
MPATPTWATLAVGLVSLWFAIRYWGFPLLARVLGNVRVNRLTPFSARNIEWRKENDAVLPTLKVKNAGWSWGGMEEAETGLFVLSIEGVTLRIKESDKKGSSDESTAPKEAPVSDLMA